MPLVARKTVSFLLINAHGPPSRPSLSWCISLGALWKQGNARLASRDHCWSAVGIVRACEAAFIRRQFRLYILYIAVCTKFGSMFAFLRGVPITAWLVLKVITKGGMLGFRTSSAHPTDKARFAIIRGIHVSRHTITRESQTLLTQTQFPIRSLLPRACLQDSPQFTRLTET